MRSKRTLTEASTAPKYMVSKISRLRAAASADSNGYRICHAEGRGAESRAPHASGEVYMV